MRLFEPGQQNLQTGTIAGWVTRNDGRSRVPGALVRVLRIDESLAPEDLAARQITSTYANDEGYYSLSLPEGTYDLRASNFHFVAQVIPSVQISPARPTRVDFRLEPSAAIFGKVRDDEGKALAGARVQALREGRHVAGTRTDEAGGYEINVNLPSGAAEVQVTHPGYAMKNLPVKVTVGSPLEVNFTLEELGSLEGWLKDEGGRTLVAEVALLQDGEELRRKTSDRSGRFIFPDLPPGRYAVIAIMAGMSCGSPQAVTIQPGEKSAPTLVLRGDCELRGLVKARVRPEGREGKESTPLHGARVRLCEGTRAVAQAAAGRRGEFRFSGLRPGRYDLVAEHPAFGVSVLPEVQVAPEGEEAEILMEPEESPSRWARIRVGEDLLELWRYRDLVRHLVMRLLRARYKESVLGLFWSMLTPLMQIIIYTVVFKFIMRSGIQNYTIFLFCALVPWNFFSQTVSDGCFALLGNRQVITKARFPRLALPFSAVLANTVHFFFTLGIFFVVTSLVLKPFVTPNSALALCALPLLILLQIIYLVGLASLLSWLNALYQDVAFMVGILLQFGFFLTPILWKAERLPELLSTVRHPMERFFLHALELTLPLNPLASLVAAYREIFIARQLPASQDIGVIAVHAIAAFAIGYFTFRRVQWSLVEEI